MKRNRASVLWCALLLGANLLSAQTLLNPNPGRFLGQVSLLSGAPNLVEGREFNAPQGVALDNSVSPPRIYVSDTFNNRVLGWRNAQGFLSGAPYADIVIGQKDFVSTNPLGPGTSLRSGLNQPTGIAVDKDGNVWVVDSGNHRILRFPKPFDQTDTLKLPDIVLGQSSLDSKSPNRGTGAPAANSISLVMDGPPRAGIAIDQAGNLWFTDGGNHRVLRYSAPQHTNDPASFVIGQQDMLSRVSTGDPMNRTNLNTPEAITVDAAGNVYVADRLNRLLIFGPNSTSAFRILGVMSVAPPPGQASQVGFYGPRGVVVIEDRPIVIDSFNSRILVFDRLPLLSDNAPALGVIGQVDFTSRKASAGAGLSIPMAAAFLGGELYVADTGNHRVVTFPYRGGFTFGSPTRVLGQLNFQFNAANLIEGRELYIFSGYDTIQGVPYAVGGGLVVDRKSDPPHLYIADTFNNRILGYRDLRKVKPGDKADIVIGQADLYSSGANFPNNSVDAPTDTGLFLPVGLALDADGNLLVADSGNGRVLRFPKPFENPQSPMHADLVLGQLDFSSKNTDPTSRTMSLPYGVAVTSGGDVLVSDAVHNRVLLFQKGTSGLQSGMSAALAFGQPDFTSTTGSNAPNRMGSPRHIAVDTSDRLYVTDPRNNRVLIYDSVGRIIAQGTRDPSPATTLFYGVDTGERLQNPEGVFVSPQTGEIWVADTQNNRVLKYREYGQLALNPVADSGSTIVANGPLAVTLDSSGNLVVAEAANRVSLYFPFVAAQNAANYLTRVAPGMYVTLKTPGGSAVSFGTQTKIFNEVNPPVPMTKTLGDIQVLVEDQPAPIHFISPNQINFFMPWSAPSSGRVNVLVVRPSTGQVIASSTMIMDVASPALFTRDATGSGQVAALIYTSNPNDQPACNGADAPPIPGFCPGGVRSVAAGEVLALFGTGQGVVPGAPPDGAITDSALQIEKPRVWIEGVPGDGYLPDSAVEYSGLGPGQIGVWQINVRIPDGLAPGNRIIFVQLKGISSIQPGIKTTIAVKAK